MVIATEHGKLSPSIDNQDECHHPVSSADDRRNTILEMLEHRKLLLERIITSRKAAELGLHESTLIPSDVEYPTTSDKTKHRNEVDIFKDMCQRATQSLGLKRSNSVLNIPQRGSISMIKSSTGRRKDFSLGRSVSEGFIFDESRSGRFMGMESSDRRYNSLDTSDLSKNNMEVELAYSSNNVTFIDKSDTLPSRDSKDSKQINPKKNPSLNSKRPMSVKMARSTSNTNALLDFVPGSSKLLDTHDALTGSFNYDSQRFKKTPVLLEQLRSQRQSIISQLELVAKKRRASLQGKFQCIEESPDLTRKPSKKKLTTTTNTSTILSSPAIAPSMDPTYSSMILPHQIPPPPFFPSRVKTQWDYVLEEMRWLATDYIEERKWKRIQARVCSEAIRLHFIDSFKKKTSPINTQLLIYSSPTESRSATFSTSSRDDLEIESYTESINELHTSRFSIPSAQDIEITRDIARLSSLQLDRYWNTFRSQHDFNANDQEDVRNIYDPYINLNEGSLLNRTSRDHVRLSSNGESIQPTKDMDLTHDQITSKINSILDHMKQVTHQINNISESTYYTQNIDQSYHPWKPYGTQLQAIFHFEHTWSSHDETKTVNTPGLILSGHHSCGKTVTVSALLWKMQSSKPHLLICPTISMSRWKYELEKFFGPKKILMFGNHAWFDFTAKLSSSNDPFIGRNLIILCEPTQYKYMLKDLEQKLSAEIFSNIFSTIVIDTRCCFPDPAVFNNSALGLRSSLSRYDSCSVCQLQSCCWWNELIIDFKSFISKRVIVEQDFNTSSQESQGLDFDEKYRYELLSAKLTFLLNSIFLSNKESPTKTFLSWARRHMRKHASSIDIPDHGSILSRRLSSSIKTGGFRVVLCHLQESLIYHLQYPSNLLYQVQQNIHHSHLQPNWNVRLCSCSRTQRSVYDKVLMSVRGALSSCNQSVRRDSEYVHRSCLLASKAFLQLRRVCFFADDGGSESLSHDFVQKNVFQPNIDMANFMIDHSAKLRELHIFLQETCGYFPSSYEKCNERLNPFNRKKILILASLPEIIFITSMFLKFLGVRNETVGVSSNCRHNSFSHSHIAPVEPSCSDYEHSPDDLWDRSLSQIIRDQHNIRRFIDSSADVLIGAPISLGHHYFGLTASSADFVICLDEDWSSRGRSDIGDILIKNFLFHHEVCRTQFIKLILENTYDQILVSPQLIHDPVILSDTQADVPITDERKLFMIKALIPLSLTDNFDVFLQILGSLEKESLSNPYFHLKSNCLSKRRIRCEDFSYSDRKACPLFYGIHNYLRRATKANLFSDSACPRVDKAKAHVDNLAPNDSDLDDSYELGDNQSLGTILDLLSYSSATCGCGPSDLVTRTDHNALEAHFHGENHYHIYEMAITARDGKQGTDMLIYFPPLFPGLLQHNHILTANYDSEPNQKQKPCALYPKSTQSAKKRKAFQGNSSSKRIRSRDTEPLHACTDSFPLFDNTFGSNLSDDMLDSVDLGLLTSDDPVFGSEYEIFEVDMTLTDPINSKVITNSGQEGLCQNRKEELPPVIASINSAIEQSIQATGVSIFVDPYDASFNVEDDNNIHPILKSLLVYMKTGPKKSLSYMHGLFGRSNSMPTNNRPPKILNTMTPTATEDAHSQSSYSLALYDYTEQQPKLIKSKSSEYTDSQSKLVKSKLSSKLFSTETEPFDSLPGKCSNELSSANIKAHQQNQSSTKSKRHDSYSSIIFSGGHKGQPYVNFRHHVMNRLAERRGMELDENNFLLQALFAREQTGENCTVSTCGENRLLHHTMNFGPFSTGFVPSCFSKEINPVFPKVCGIELPMGVRNNHANVDNYQGKAAWSESDGLRLHMLAKHFKGNWNLIRMAIMDQNQLGNDYNHNSIRSSHQCEEKWISSIREKQPFQDILDGRYLDFEDHDSSCYSLSRSLLSTTSTNSLELHVQNMSMLTKANLKQRRMQISLPGPNSHGTAASLPIVNPHLSHTQSVHDALGTLGGQTRSEMWPLQLLDNIDKQHQVHISSSSASHPSSSGNFLKQKGSSTSPVNNHNVISRSHPTGNGSKSPQMRTSNTTQPTSNVNNHPQYSNHRYPVPDTT